MVPPFLEQLQDLANKAPQGLERLRSWTSWLQNLIPEQVVQDLRNWEGITEQLQFPSSYRHRVEEILQQCEVGLGGWVTVTLFNMIVIAVLNAIAL